jgi:hypothetical protein
VIEQEQPWDEVVSDVVEILLQLGESDGAERVLDVYADRAGGLWWLLGEPAELRCRALLRAAGGDLPGALALLDEAVSALEDGPGSTWLGRTLLARGGVLRLQGRAADAMADLERAARVLTRHGPASWRAAAQRAALPACIAAAEPGEVVAVLTAGHWSDHEITTGLRRALHMVQEELRIVRPPLTTHPASRPRRAV